MSRLKILLIVAGLALLLACVAVLTLRRDRPVAATVASTSDPSFEVLVDWPLLTLRPPWEIPGIILGTRDRGPRFNHTSAGAKIGSVTPNRLELSADGGWDLLIETDSNGQIAPSTRLVFPIDIGSRHLKFRCVPAERPVGHLDARTRANSDKLDGSFLIELPNCKNAESGKNTAGTPVFTIKGSFKGLKLQG
jgi:hypothetical protein